jgi:beta-lactam-binding protein with PASTA domain
MLPEGHFADLPPKENPQPPAVITPTEQTPKRTIGRMVLWVVGALCVLIVLFWIGLAMVQNAGGTLKAVPDVTGQNSAKAQELLKEANLLVTFEHAFSETVPEDHVISQTPQASSLVKEKSNVRLIISAGPEQIAVPNVVGMTLLEATQTLESYGRRVGVVSDAYVPGVADGIVVSQQPQAESGAIIGDEVDLILSNQNAGAEPETTP